MRVLRRTTAAIVIASLAALSLPAHADDRAGLRACQAMVDRAAKGGVNDAKLLTPPSTVRAFAAGYRPVLHESVEQIL